MLSVGEPINAYQPQDNYESVEERKAKYVGLS